MAQLIKDMGHTGTEYAADGIAKIPSFTLGNAVNMIRLQNGEPANFSAADAAKLGLDSSRAYDRTQEGLASLMADTAAYLKGSPTLPKSDLEDILKASRQTDLPVATLPAAPAVPVAQARFQPTQPGA